MWCETINDAEPAKANANQIFSKWLRDSALNRDNKKFSMAEFMEDTQH
tara:strand:+ start:405 stop:548 length:144 start_codon:yes stop_codon:yes gene_type:complete